MPLACGKFLMSNHIPLSQPPGCAVLQGKGCEHGVPAGCRDTQTVTSYTQLPLRLAVSIHGLA
eukprot:6198461-Pleurochrysis_carterae.AAC.2